jgi:hypothetical protein
LNGICLSDDKSFSDFQQSGVDYKGFEADMVDKDAYTFLSILEKNKKLENCVVLKVVVGSGDFELRENLVVLDFFV